MVRIIRTADLDSHMYESAVAGNEADGCIFDYDDYPIFKMLGSPKPTPPKPIGFLLGKSVTRKPNKS